MNSAQDSASLATTLTWRDFYITTCGNDDNIEKQIAVVQDSQNKGYVTQFEK